jgi:hypothetical protein
MGTKQGREDRRRRREEQTTKVEGDRWRLVCCSR